MSAPDADGRVVEVGIVRLGRLSSGDERQIEGNVGVPEDFPSPTRRFKYRIEAEFVDGGGESSAPCYSQPACCASVSRPSATRTLQSTDSASTSSG